MCVLGNDIATATVAEIAVAVAGAVAKSTNISVADNLATATATKQNAIATISLLRSK